jgi:hypothetical protein
VNDRQIILTALAGESASDDPNANNVLGIAFEFLCAEADELVDHFPSDGVSTAFSLALAHASRCHALKAFVSEHMKASFAEANDTFGLRKSETLRGPEATEGSAGS